jgi:hypothetical protein
MLHTPSARPRAVIPSAGPANSWIVGNPEVIPAIFRKILAAAVGRTRRSVPVLFQFAEPDVAVADRMIVILQCKPGAPHAVPACGPFIFRRSAGVLADPPLFFKMTAPLTSRCLNSPTRIKSVRRSQD